MALLPISSTRVSEPLKNQRLLNQLNSDQIALQRQFDQLSSGQRVTRVSDDPAAAGRAIILQRGISRADQLSRNAGVTQSFYAATDDALGRVDESLIEARGVTVEAAQSVLSSDERNALAVTIRRTLESVVAAGNTLFRDHQILGGYLQTAGSLTVDEADIVFGGSDAIARTKVGGGDLFAVGVNGTESLGLASTVIQGSPLQTGLDEKTRLSDLRGGQGARPGPIRVSDGGNFVDVDLTSAATVGDVIEILESINFDGRSLAVDILPDGLRIDFADGAPGTLAIEDAVGESLARDLSILNPLGVAAPPLVSTGLAPRITADARLSRLNGGAGINVAAGLQIQQGSRTFTADLSQAETIADVLIAINRSGADVRAELDAKTGGIAIRSLRSGVDYSIGENGGLAATALGLRTASEATKLSELDQGRGVVLNEFGPEFSILRPDGVQLDFELSGGESVGDVLNLIRDHPSNQDTLKVIPNLNPVGNGIELVAPPGPAALTVRAGNVGNAAELLGFLGKGQTEATGIVSGPIAILRGRDYLPKEAGGTIDTLLRLEAAVRDGNIPELERLQKRLDSDFDLATRVRGRVGVLSQNVEQLKDSAEDQSVALKAELSTEIDADLATVISELQQRQTSLEASLKLIGESARLTLLDFL